MDWSRAGAPQVRRPLRRALEGAAAVPFSVTARAGRSQRLRPGCPPPDSRRPPARRRNDREVPAVVAGEALTCRFAGDRYAMNLARTRTRTRGAHDRGRLPAREPRRMRAEVRGTCVLRASSHPRRASRYERAFRRRRVQPDPNDSIARSRLNVCLQRQPSPHVAAPSATSGDSEIRPPTARFSRHTRKARSPCSRSSTSPSGMPRQQGLALEEGR